MSTTGVETTALFYRLQLSSRDIFLPASLFHLLFLLQGELGISALGNLSNFVAFQWGYKAKLKKKKLHDEVPGWDFRESPIHRNALFQQFPEVRLLRRFKFCTEKTQKVTAEIKGPVTHPLGIIRMRKTQDPRIWKRCKLHQWREDRNRLQYGCSKHVSEHYPKTPTIFPR